MYVTKKESRELLQQFHSELFDNLEQKKEALFQIVKEDDWSFVIKSHAFIEAMVTEIIIAQVNDERIRPTIERLPLSDEQAGKLKMAKDLGLLSVKERKFIKQFSNLRNNLAHRIDNMNFTFESYIDSLDKNQKKSWVETISWYTKDENKDFYQEQALQSPKMVIFIGILVMSSIKLVKGVELNSLRQLNVLAQETTKNLIGEV